MMLNNKTIALFAFIVQLSLVCLPYSLCAQSIERISTVELNKNIQELTNPSNMGQTGGQCVAYVKSLRPDGLPTLADINPETKRSDGGPAWKMYSKASAAGFHVEQNLPRIGSVIVFDVNSGMTSGHVGIVTNITPVSGGYRLEFVDSNGDPSNNPEKIGIHQIKFSVGANGNNGSANYYVKATDGKEYVGHTAYPVLGFVHEKETNYKGKMNQAIDYITRTFNEKLGRVPSDTELKTYSALLFAGSDPSGQKLNNYIQLAKNADKASLEANKSLLTQTMKGLPEAAKDVSQSSIGYFVSLLSSSNIYASASTMNGLHNSVSDAQNQTTQDVDKNPPYTLQGNYYGHYAGMLTKNGAYEDVYSTLEPTYIATSNIRVPAYKSSRAMIVNGVSDPPQITSLETSTGTATVGIPVSITMTELGSNSYLKWGYWLQSNAMNAGGTNYYYDNRGYYLKGDPSTDAQMTNLAAQRVSGVYSGTAAGTFWRTNTGGTNMSGSFNANVDFASRSVNNIIMSISGGGHSASISGATATFSGSSSKFVGNADGQWKIDGATLGSSSSKDLRGAVCGPTGKAVGGGFGMGQSTATTGIVIGIFQGTR